MSEDADEEDLRWGEPTPANVQHIFGADGRSLCGTYGFFPAGRGAPVEAGAAYVEGQDCKACCEAADAVTVDEEAEDDE